MISENIDQVVLMYPRWLFPHNSYVCVILRNDQSGLVPNSRIYWSLESPGSALDVYVSSCCLFGLWFFFCCVPPYNEILTPHWYFIFIFICLNIVQKKKFKFDPVPFRMSHDSSVIEDIHNLIIVTKIRPIQNVVLKLVEMVCVCR